MEGGARPLVVGGVICQVNSGNERDARLSNSLVVVKRSKDFLATQLAQVSGSRAQMQVCHALRYSGRHARYNDQRNKFFILGREVWAIFERWS